MLRAIPKVGTRRTQWLIVNEHGGLVVEFTGTKRQADAEVKRRAANALCVRCVELPTECSKCGPSCQCDIAWNH